MNLQKKTKAAAPPTPVDAQVESETQDEIEQIMSEIEELQQEMSATSGAPVAAAAPLPIATKPAPKTAPAVVAMPEPVTAPAAIAEAPAEEGEHDVMKEFQGSGEEPSMEETLGNLKEDEPAGPSLLDVPHGEADAEAEAVAETESETAAEIAAITDLDQEGATMNDEGSMTITLNGNMTLNLKYEVEGQEVVVGFANGALRVQLADGTEFKIPVARNAKPQPIRKAG